MKLTDKLHRKLLKLRLQPIRVFCFHQVSDKFDDSTMWECDWTNTEQFKRNIMLLKSRYTFITLTEAYEKLQRDRLRFRKYAVLTADDGWASLKNIIPWLAEQKIPITLFVNAEYLDGKHFQERETEKLLTKNDIIELINNYSQCISIASHGETHIDSQRLLTQEFVGNVVRAEEILAELPNKISFYAFTYGKYLIEQIDILEKCNLVPVLMDGKVNYIGKMIHRECIDGYVPEI